MALLETLSRQHFSDERGERSRKMHLYAPSKDESCYSHYYSNPAIHLRMCALVDGGNNG